MDKRQTQADGEYIKKSDVLTLAKICDRDGNMSIDAYEVERMLGVAIPSAEPQDSEDKIIRRTLKNFMRGLWEEIQVGELEYTTSEVYEMLEREIFTDNHVDIPPSDKWIPCSEQLPKEGEDVLACFYTGEGNYKMMVSRRSDYNYWSGVGRTADMVAWMPLPKPYEPQESEE